MLVEFGGTKVLCAASASEGVPRWRKGSGLGWVTAEYAMLPAATNTRSDRESVKGRIGGRTHEISRLIGRSLRAVIDYEALGENTIVLDCDVLQADGGTRTAAITGAYVALADAVAHLRGNGALTGEPLTGSVAAVSVGIIDGVPRLDLPYVEDVRAETDMNVVMTGDGKFVEVQGTAEGAAFDRAELDALLALAEKGCADLTRMQQEALAPVKRIFLASGNAKKIVEMQRILAEHVPGIEVLGIARRRGLRRAGRGPADLRGQRPAEGARRRRRHRAAVGRRRQRAVRRRAQRHAGRAVGAVVRASEGRSPGVGATTAQQRAAARPARRRTRRAARRALRLRRGVGDARRPRARRRGPDGRPHHPRGARGSGGFGYDVLFVADEHDAEGLTSAELDAGREGPDLAPRAGAARARAAGRGGPVRRLTRPRGRRPAC